jgi:hypothetical protein
MAQQVYAFPVTVAAGTPSTAPTAVDVSFPQAIVTEVQIIVPDGHAGLTGIALQQAHQAVIPKNAGHFIVSNDEKLSFPLEDFLDNGNWQALVYNTDIYGHTFYLRFLCATIGTAVAPPAAPAPPPALLLPAAPLPATVTGVADVPAQ